MRIYTHAYMYVYIYTIIDIKKYVFTKDCAIVVDRRVKNILVVMLCNS